MNSSYQIQRFQPLILKYLPLVLVGMLVLLILRPYLVGDFPATHDGQNHLARMVGYKRAIGEGQFPPRWGSHFLNNYGYPVYNFNYPLANILALPGLLIGIHVELVFKIIVIAATVMGLLGWYILLKNIYPSSRIVWLSLASMLLSPYLINIYYFRGGIGELLAFTFFPWVTVSLFTPKIQHSFLNSLLKIIIVAGFLLTHNLSVILLLPMIILIVISTQLQQKIKIQPQRLVINFLLGFCLVAWFWIPAIWEQGYTVLREVSLATEASKHLVTIDQLLWSPSLPGYSFLGPADTSSFQIGLAQLFIFLTAIIVVLVSRKTTYFNVLLMLVAGSAILFQLTITTSLWQLFPILSIIQFPWRLSMFFTICIALLVPMLEAFIRQNRTWSYCLFVLISIQLFIFVRMAVPDRFHFPNEYYYSYPQSTSTLNENRAKAFVYPELGDWSETPQIIGAAEISQVSWSGNEKSYQISTQDTVKVIEQTMNFLGWETVATDANGNLTSMRYEDDDVSQGRIMYQLQPGNYKVDTRFTQNTPARMIGNAISLLGPVMFGLTLLWRKKIQK